MGNHCIDCDFCGEDLRLTTERGCRTQDDAFGCYKYERSEKERQANEPPGVNEYRGRSDIISMLRAQAIAFSMNGHSHLLKLLYGAAGRIEDAERRAFQLAQEAGDNAKRVRQLEAEVEKLKELNDKYMWQVRDTCTRAEQAEAKVLRLKTVLNAAY